MVKVAMALVILLFTATYSIAQDVYHQGYYRQNGTYVQPHYQTRPDNNVYNNYSTYPNTNPYTGQQGRIQPQPNYGNQYQYNPSYGQQRKRY